MAKHTLIILSDLHLSAVQPTESGDSTAYEGFHYDQAFSHFIDHVVKRIQSEYAEFELLILGDFLDFLHTKVPLTKSNLLISTEASSLQKFQAIFRAHPLFFAALKRFVSTGFRLSIVPGNHDIDLMRPAVQRVLKESIETDSVRNIHFYSWIYYVSGVLYAEHGHQYHDITAYSTLLAPFRTGNKDEREFTITDYFDLYLFHLIKRLKPPAENIDAPLRYLLNLYRTQPLKLINTLPDLCRFLYVVARQFAYRSSRQFRDARQSYHEEVLSMYAASTELPHETCVALDQLAELNNIKMVKRILGRILSKNRGDPIKTGFHYPKALMISKILSSKKKAVPFYVFGHSHELAKVALDNQPGAFYLNSGTWASLSYPGSLGDRSLFPFVEIEWANNKRPTARLMQWDETQQKAVKVDEV